MMMTSRRPSALFTSGVAGCMLANGIENQARVPRSDSCAARCPVCLYPPTTTHNLQARLHAHAAHAPFGVSG